MKRFNTLLLTQTAIFSAISICLVALIRVPIIPIVPFLEYDMADVPILIATMMMSIKSGLIILFIVSALQSFLIGGSGWVGFLMHFIASASLIIIVGLFYKKDKSVKSEIIGMVLGCIAMTLIMIPMNYIFTVNFWGMPKEVLDTLIIPGIIPFNLIKSGLNCLISFILFRFISANYKTKN